ncbi:MAG: MarR family transcriptional regulator [Candidatus Dormibacteraeota bacterium]|nr:MarR family transcriptional regulator [Candidatus Dormibacteraeota bacterium]
MADAVAVAQPKSNDRQIEYQAIGARLRDLSLTFAGLSAAMAARLGLNRNDLRALDILIEHRGMTAGELAAELKLTTGAITGVIDRLEVAGHAVRMHDDEDRRKVVVRATRKAAEAREEAMRPIREDLDVLLEDYSGEGLAVIQSFLERTGALLMRHSGVA